MSPDDAAFIAPGVDDDGRPSLPLRDFIAASWLRCEAAGVDPRDAPLRQVPPEEVQARLERNAALIDIARPHLQWLVSALGKNSHTAYLVDADGIVLGGYGDPGVIERFGLTPGYDWSERRMGTNGAGTALMENKPLVVHGPEHYVEAFRSCTCTGAPLHDADGNIVGAIDISTGTVDEHPDRLSLIAHVAFVIDREFAYCRTIEDHEAYRAVAERLRVEQEKLRAANAHLHAVLENAPALIWLIDRDDRFRHVNRRFCEILDRPADEILGRALDELFPKPVALQLKANNARVFESEVPLQFEETIGEGDKARTYLSVKVPIFDEHGLAIAQCGIASDITDRKQMEQRLEAATIRAERLAYTDELTGLANRRAFFEEGALQFERNRRKQQPMAVIMLDIDHFKSINDAHGHATGDRVLVAVAQTVSDMLRDTDICARLGGEEFALVMPVQSAQDAVAMAERLREAIAAIELPDTASPVRCTASFGVAFCKGAARATLQDVLAKADGALFAAKRGGRNRVRYKD